ncbi:MULTISPECIES: hypothetical protein [unclassified Nocardioides]|uniref:hypothetical protein n=1 Tax=unclassified Nocardioides TaxID=2615069 RepID=UPI003014F427
MRRTLHDHPFSIDILLVGFVTLHWLVTVPPILSKLNISRVPSPWSSLAGTNDSSVRDLYIAMFGPSAIVAGFAGVVVVFGLSSDAPRFRKFRADAGDSLKRTWVSSSLSGFVAGFAFVAATVVNFAGAEPSAPFLFEFGLLVLVHGAARLLWILRALIGIKATDDLVAVAKDDEVPLDDMPWRRTG